MKLFSTLLLLLVATTAQAQTQNPLVLLDTDYGPLLIELDAERTPNLATNFLRYVDAGRYTETVFARVARKDSNGNGIDIVQGGGFTATGAPVTNFDAVSATLPNGLSNTRGTIAAALPANSAGQPNLNAVTGGFYFNVTNNSAALDSGYPVFGRVVFGLANLDVMLAAPRFTGGEQPIRPPFVKRALRVDAFPVLELHTGAWFDPQKSGRGFSVEIARDPDNANGAVLVVYWYDYFQGQQVWMNGAADFIWGADEVVVPMQITQGGQFGSAFDPSQVQNTPDWGTLTVRFNGCKTATFSYESAFGNGSMNLERLTQPVGTRCDP
ncbi:peptidylprolyl isomerase [Pseudomarimonas salicorniae]|uniref:Peptidylprolyl isomerase n=1 Tax=Pseudomarimonas salicorniae TaxID=2933270 RepID=A0ABT0GKP6_9GAMM|nr:peptidylprolyl isomerase [Lysobacter sp. CAU 1642]MCK7594988.1 peptidylprolyl isomerase [Lysobacter sp. CAU 1642]